jgi:hypothetical protein
VTRKRGERDPEHDLARPLRPAGTTLGVLEPAQVATHVDQYAAELRADSGERAPDAFLGCYDIVRQLDA